MPVEDSHVIPEKHSAVNRGTSPGSHGFCDVIRV
jgi:hypothetical protein